MTTKIDISDYYIIDAHCHPFKETTKVLNEDEFTFIADYFAGFSNLAFLIPPDVLEEYGRASDLKRHKLDNKYQVSKISESLRQHAQNLVLHKRMMRELSQLLDCAPTPKHIVEARNRRASDYSAYIKMIFEDARIEGLNVDDGYSELAVRSAIPAIDLDEFKSYVPAKVWRTTRIEPLFQNALETSTKFDEMESTFLASMERAVKKMGAVSFKSIIAYRSGLEIVKERLEEAKKDFKRYKSKKTLRVYKDRYALRHLRNYILWNAVKKSMELDVPFLLHTGIGDQDIILNKCNPACLWNMLVNEELRHAKIVLVHAGYPFLSEAAFLTSVLPNVYLDLSVLIPLGQTNPHRLAQILETAPLTKVMYASDVHLPEMYWLSAKIGKSMLSQALSQIVNVGVLTEDEAHKAAQRILKDNAKEFYKL